MNTLISQKETCGPEECSELNKAHITCVRTRTHPVSSNTPRAWSPYHAAVMLVCSFTLPEDNDWKGWTKGADRPRESMSSSLMVQGSPRMEMRWCSRCPWLLALGRTLPPCGWCQPRAQQFWDFWSAHTSFPPVTCQHLVLAFSATE